MCYNGAMAEQKGASLRTVLALFLSIGGIVLLLGALFSCRTGGTPAELREIDEAVKDGPLMEEALSEKERLWLLGGSALFVELNGGNVRSLVPFEKTKRTRREWQGILERSWGVISRDSFYSKLERLEERGDSLEYERLLPAAADPEKTYADLARSGDYNRQELKRIWFLDQLDQDLPRANTLKGWDLGRAMVLCRWAVLAGYISRDEAWTEMARLGGAAARRFSSWGELGANIALGRGFWQAPYGRPEAVYQEVLGVMAVLSGPGRIWSEVSWEEGERAFSGLISE